MSENDETQLRLVFLSVLFGEVIGYIGGALEQLSYNPGEIWHRCRRFLR
ncbi:DUF2929 family protein [Lactiplantibacillus plantarum]|nr:DUF2929 family protein [Lactiplantibacillus plantarum]